MYTTTRKARQSDCRAIGSRSCQRKNRLEDSPGFVDNRPLRPSIPGHRCVAVQRYEGYGDAFWSGLKDGFILNVHNLSAGFLYPDRAKKIIKKHKGYGKAADIFSKIGSTAAWAASGAYLTRTAFSGTVASASRYGPCVTSKIISAGSHIMGMGAGGNIYGGLQLLNQGNPEQALEAVQSGIFLLGPAPSTRNLRHLRPQGRGNRNPICVWKKSTTRKINGRSYTRKDVLTRQNQTIIYGQKQQGVIGNKHVNTELIAIRQGNSFSVAAKCTIQQGNKIITYKLQVRLDNIQPVKRGCGVLLPLQPNRQPVFPLKKSFSNQPKGSDAGPGESMFSYFTPREMATIIKALAWFKNLTLEFHEPGVASGFKIDIDDVPGWPGFIKKHTDLLQLPRDGKKIQIIPELWHLLQWKNFSARWQKAHKRPLQYDTFSEFIKYREMIEVMEKTYLSKIVNKQGSTYTPHDKKEVSDHFEGYRRDLSAWIKGKTTPKRDYKNLFKSLKDPRALELLNAHRAEETEPLLGPRAVEALLTEKEDAFSPVQQKQLRTILSQMKLRQQAHLKGTSKRYEVKKERILSRVVVETLRSEIQSLVAHKTLTQTEGSHLTTMITLYLTCFFP